MCVVPSQCDAGLVRSHPSSPMELAAATETQRSLEQNRMQGVCKYSVHQPSTPLSDFEVIGLLVVSQDAIVAVGFAGSFGTVGQDHIRP